MDYIDSGNREASQALGTWLSDILTEDVSEVRWQSGFFTADSLGILEPTLKRLAETASPVKALIGANDQATRRDDVEQLVDVMRASRSDADLGVVSFQNSYFHPKTFHVRRSDGTQAGYVGSANLTGAGISSLHVEAGLTLDTRQGDSEILINSIADAVDFWFLEERAGLYRVNGIDDVRRLTEQGILSELPPARPTDREGGRRGTQGRARLKPLVPLPRLGAETIDTSDEEVSPLETVRRIVLPSVPKAGFPQYLLFAPGTSVPTSGELALSGSNLPTGISGLVIKLNRDSARHFEGRSGTANISIPVATLGTFRFGLFNGRFIRPRAEFPLEVRYITNGQVIGPFRGETSIMAYGFIPGETGHGDVRMVIPAMVRNLIAFIQSTNAPLPEPEDAALLEWPTAENGAVLRLTFLDRRYGLHREAQRMLSNAISNGESIGNGACWLPGGFAPSWSGQISHTP